MGDGGEIGHGMGNVVGQRRAAVINGNATITGAQEQRAAGWSNLFEWFQWLAERMDERTPMSSDVPAQIKYRSWTKPSDYTRLR